MLKRKRQKAIVTLWYAYTRPRLVDLAGATRARALGTRADVHRKRLRRLEVLDHGAEIDRSRIKRFVFRNLAPVHDAKAVTLKHLFSAPALEGHDLAVDALLAASIKVTQICADQRARGRHFTSVRLEVNVKMRRSPRRGGHFAPAVADHPANEPARPVVVT
jgi:hypothetical protein